MINNTEASEMRYLILTMLVFSALFFVSDTYGQKKTYKATIDNDGVQRVEVTGGEYFFDPDRIILKVNVPVELKAKKEAGIVPHNIVVHEPGAGIDFSESLGKEPKVIKFTPKKIGKYPFSCDKKLLFFKSHKDKGMEGVFEVVE
jgi:plastocyanin domain-containing protein